MKILSNKKYNELILKSCRGMFGAVTDDMLLRENALLNEENKQLKEEIEEYKRIEQKDLKAFNNYDSILTELEEWLKEEWNITSKSPKGSFYEGYDTCMLEMKEDIQNKIQELKEKYK